MTSAVPTILDRIVARKRNELERMRNARRDFEAALRRPGPSIIAELKKASPSRGVLSPDYNPARTAPLYEHGGAAALSVLTDAESFQGSLDDLRAARSVTSVPVLRKDFTTSAFHIVEAAMAGADAILLIAAVLPGSQLRSLRELAEEFGLAALVEVHDRAELDRAIDSGARIIGVNNRDLRTFEVRLETSLELAPWIPRDAVRVSESGIHSASDVRTLSSAGYDAFLVGEHLITSPDPAAAVRNLLA